jgi:hypothetical protein
VPKTAVVEPGAWRLAPQASASGMASCEVERSFMETTQS